MQQSPAARRLVLVHDEPLIARALADQLSAGTGWPSLVVDGVQGAPRLLDPNRPEVLVVLADSAAVALLDRVAELRRAHPRLVVVILSRRISAEALRPLLGARGDGLAIVERCPQTDLTAVLGAIRAAVEGRPSLPATLLQRLAGPHADAGLQQSGSMDELSQTEQLVLDLLAAGLSNAAIAHRLGRSVKVVERHVGHLYAKLGLATRDRRIERRVLAARFRLGERPE